MLATVSLEIACARTMPRRSPFTSVTWALDIATSVPVPIAMPTSAPANAGASLIPSPAMATLWPLACSARTRSILSCGRTSPWTSSMPSVRATALAVVTPSPVAMTIFKPAACRDAMASPVVALMGSDTAISPANAPSTARYMTLAPDARSASADDARLDASTPTSCIKAVLPIASEAPPTLPRTPMPVADSKPSGVSSGSSRRRASATIASASGCSLP